MPGLAFHSHYWQTQEPVIPDPPAGGASSVGGHFPWVLTMSALLFVLALQGM